MTTATLTPTAGETTLTLDQLADRLMTQTGTTFATLTTRTDARCRKTANPFGTVYKTSRVNVALGTDYAAGVNRQRGREGNDEAFTAQSRQWGTVLAGCVVEHKGKLYLRCKVERSLAHHYEDAEGSLLDPEAVAPFLPAKRKATNQGVQREVIERSYALTSILTIAIDGQVYRVAPGSNPQK